MTTLTEQWKQGKLPSGWYYVKLIRGEYRTDLYIKDKNEWIDYPEKIISDVLAEVPSFNRWELIRTRIRSKIRRIKKLCISNKKLHEKNTKLKETISNDIFLIRSRDSEIAKLKELLKECCYRIDWTDVIGHKPTDDRKQKLFNDIEQVLQENE